MGWADNAILELRAGRAVTVTPRGNSMMPLIRSGESIRIVPISRAPHRGDVVLCRVAGRQFLHKIKAIRDGRCLIENNHGHENGWASEIYGFAVLRKATP